MAQAKRTSTGHELSDSQWLDAHFEAARAEYEAALNEVGVRPGWTALDAGCGNGGFLPTLGKLVGPSGAVFALDLAPENVALIEAQIREGALPQRVAAKVGSVLALPFGEAEFDFVWCANVVQYLTDAEFAKTLAEFQRVAKPGAIIAVKEYDCLLTDMRPMDDDYVGRLWAARRARATDGALGAWGGSSLGSRFRRAGLSNISCKGWLVERWAPPRHRCAPSSKAFYRAGPPCRRKATCRPRTSNFGAILRRTPAACSTTRTFAIENSSSSRQVERRVENKPRSCR